MFTNWKDNLLLPKKKNGLLYPFQYRAFSIDRAELTESRSVSPIEANSNGETRGKTSELSRRPSSSLFPRTFLSWFLALVAALSFSPPSCLFYFLFYSRRVRYPAQGIVRIPNSYLNAVRSNFFFFFFVSKPLCSLDRSIKRDCVRLELLISTRVEETCERIGRAMTIWKYPSCWSVERI